jgi:hypothetical protein
MIRVNMSFFYLNLLKNCHYVLKQVDSSLNFEKILAGI